MTDKQTCTQCGKPIAGDGRVGSLTSYLFQGSSCSCNRSSSKNQDRTALKASGDDKEFCPRCGLVKVTGKKAGSLTSYMFQDTRCRCVEDETFDASAMVEKFWNLQRSKSPEGDFVAGAGAGPVGGRGIVNLDEGATIAGVYKILKLIGRGGMGEVYLARHATLNKKLALKVMPPEQVTAIGWQRFQAEARLSGKIDHKNLVRVSDLGIHEGCLPFYAMDYVEGDTLSDIIAAQGRMRLADVLEIFSQVCDGVDFAHRAGIIHRDLKPANIIVGNDNAGKLLVKILDFGLAKLTQHDRDKQSLTAVGEIFGSPFYMSPEQCAGEKIDNRSDVYSLGCTMYECLCARPPFTGIIAQAIMNAHQHGDAPSLADAVGPGVYSDAMEVVMAKLLRKNPAERYQTVGELKGDLERVSRGQEVAPFYVSRTAAAGRTADSKTSAEPGDSSNYTQAGGQSESLAGRPLWQLFAALLAGVAIIGAITYLATSAMFAPRKKATVVVKKAQEGSAPPASVSVWESTPMYQGIVQRPGGPMKLWNFPTNVANVPAVLGASIPGTAGKMIKKKCVGPVTMDANSEITFFPLREMSTEPAFIDGLTDGNIDCIEFQDFPAGDFAALAPFLAKLRSVRGITITNMDGDKNSQQMCLDFINDFPKLTVLQIDSLADGGAFARIGRMKSLVRLSAGGVEKDLADFFKSFAGSTALMHLTLTGMPLSLESVRELAKCPNLKSLIYKDVDPSKPISESLLAQLSTLPNLSTLSITVIEYSDALVKIFARFKTLKNLSCQYSDSWTEADKLKLKKALPNCDILGTHQVANRAVIFDEMKGEGARGR